MRPTLSTRAARGSTRRPPHHVGRPGPRLGGLVALFACLAVQGVGGPAGAANDLGSDATAALPATTDSSPSAAAVDPSLYYVPTYSTADPPRPLRWMRSNCVIMRANSAGSADVADDSELEALNRAVANWTAATQACSFLRLKVLEPSADAKPGFDRQGPNENVVSWIEDDWQSLKAGDGPAATGASAITIVFFNDQPTSADYGRIYDADIYLNGQHFTFSTGGERGLTDVENVLTHELGHVMGLDHTCDDGQRRPVPLDNSGHPIPSCSSRGLSEAVTEATMYPNASTGETKKRSPEVGDVHGICQTYPLAKDPKRCEPVDVSPRGGGCALGSPATGAAARRDDTPATRGALGLLLLGALLALGRLRRGRLDGRGNRGP